MPNTPTNFPRNVQPRTFDRVITLTTTRQLKATEQDALVIFNSATAFTVTLPRAFKGARFTFFIKTPAGATGHVVAVGTGPKMFGKVSPTGAATAGTVSKGRLNTQATSVQGDGLVVESDGVDWYATPTGTWAEQP